MPITNKKLLVAIESLAYIAVNSSDRPVSSKEICEHLGLKMRYTEQIMQKLVKSGVLKGVRGASGGYYLARDRRKITLDEIYAVVKSLSKNKGLDESGEPFRKMVTEINDHIDEELNKILAAINLEDIYTKAKKLNDASGKTDKANFVI